MSFDPDTCVFCAAQGCLSGTVAHGQGCPFTTGLWPVDDEMARRETDCMACGERFKAGETYAEVRADSWPIEGFVNNIASEWERVGEVSLGVCLPCAAIGRPVQS